MFGIRFNEVHLFSHTIHLGWLGAVLSVLWLVGVANAVNIIDGIDTLAGSTCVISFFTLALFASFIDAYSVMIVCFLLAGLTGGFLIHNVSPARIFLGDTGSLFLGMSTALLSMYLFSMPGNSGSILVLPLIIALPLLDVSVAMTRRFFKRILARDSILNSLKAMTVADNEHLHHRLVHRGLTHIQSSLILSIFSLTCCISTFLILHFRAFQIPIVGYVCVITLWLLYRLDLFERFNAMLMRRRERLQNRMEKEWIAVIDADPVFRQALCNYAQSGFVFSFFSSQDIATYNGKYAALLFNSTQAHLITQESRQCAEISNKYGCVVLFLADVPLPAGADGLLQNSRLAFLK
jgi:hypothetical protein